MGLRLHGAGPRDFLRPTQNKDPILPSLHEARATVLLVPLKPKSREHFNFLIWNLIAYKYSRYKCPTHSLHSCLLINVNYGTYITPSKEIEFVWENEIQQKMALVTIILPKALVYSGIYYDDYANI